MSSDTVTMLTTSESLSLTARHWKTPAISFSLAVALVVIGGLSLYLQMHTQSIGWLTAINLKGAIAMIATGGVACLVGIRLLFRHYHSTDAHSQPSSLKVDIKQVSLPNYTTRHINEHGDVFSLTPIGGHRRDQYKGDLSEYQSACLEHELKINYNEDGYLIYNNSVLKHSLAQKENDLHATAHIINLWIQSCYFIVVKSNRDRYWFLHYDDGQSRGQSNSIKGMSYHRPNYSDLKPILPYEIQGVSLQENETVRVLVIHPQKGYDINDSNNSRNGNFDAQVFKTIIGENNITSIRTICYRELTEFYPIEIDFQTIDDALRIFPMAQREHLIYQEHQLFQEV